MSASPRSARLVSASGWGPQLTPLFTGPAGYTTLVKSYSLSNRNANAQNVQVVLQQPGHGTVLVLNNPAFASGTILNTECWLVLNPGDLLYVNALPDGIDVWVSGSYLTGVPPFP